LSPLFPITDIVLQDLKKEALNIIDLDLPFYCRYVDDILPADKAIHILNTFNSFHERLQFTIEYEKDHTLSLDLSLSVMTEFWLIGFIKKPSRGGIYLISLTIRDHKIGIIYNLVDRAILLLHLSFQRENLKLCIKILLDNRYLLDLIFREINRRLKKQNFNFCHKRASVESTTDSNNKKYFIIQYLHNIFKMTASVIKKSNFIFGFKGINKFNNFIRIQKDKTNFMLKNNVVYKLLCNNCDVSMRGKQKDKLKLGLKNTSTIWSWNRRDIQLSLSTF